MTVYARVKDANGSTSACLSSTATWTNTAPISSYTYNSPQNENTAIRWT